MLPSSAPMFEPSFPAQIKPVISGPSDRTTACYTSEGNHDSAPNDARDGRDCFVNTTPARNAVNIIRKSDLLPKRNDWFKVSLISYGGKNASLKNRATKRAMSARCRRNFLKLICI